MKRSRGVLFVSVLLVMVVVSMFTGAFLVRSRGTLFGAASYRDGVRAEQAARGGVNHLMAILESDNAFASSFEGKIGEARYIVTFSPSQPHFSVNNLSADTESSQLSFQGHKVAPRSADLLVVGQCGQSRRVLRVVVQQGLTAGRSAAAVGRVSLAGNVTVDGVKSLLPPPGKDAPDPAPGGIVSKYRAHSSHPAIQWSDGGSANFTLGELSRLETAPAETGNQAVSSNLHTLFPDQIVEEGAALAIPDIDVDAQVTAGMAHPPLPGGATQTGYVVVKDERSFAGDLSITGDLVLNGGTLFVDGDLTIHGGVEGLGALYVRGKLTVRGGNTVVQTSQPAGVAMLAGSDIRLEGIDLYGYLDAMASTDPTFQVALQDLKNGLQYYQDDSATSLWGRSSYLAKSRGTLGAVSWISPFPGPDGTFNFGDSSGVIPAVARHAKAFSISNPTDDRAEKVVSALEELQFFFRHNLHNVRVDATGEMYGLTATGGSLGMPQVPLIRLPDYQLGLLSTGLPVPAGPTGDPLGDFHYPPGPYLGMDWDDRDLPVESHTHDHLNSNLDAQERRRDAFLLYNPADLSFLGKSSLQGLIYSRGDIHADTKFRVIGSLISLGNITLTNGSTLIFNEEYRKAFGARLPLAMVHVEEI